MEPFLINIIIAVISLVYVFTVVGIMDKFVKKGFPSDVSRKIVHIAAGSWLIFWAFYNNDTSSKYFNILPAVVWFVLLLQKGFFAKPDDEAVKTMTRTGDRSELLRGPLYFTIIMMIMGTVYYYSTVAIVTMGFLGWGDGLAPIFGKRYGTIKYRVFVEKSLQGSLAFLVFGILGTFLFHIILNYPINFSLILLTGVVATIAEAISPKDLDNFLIPLACLVVYII